MATGLPTGLAVEVEYSAGVWTDETANVALDDAPVEIHVGRADAASDPQPGSCTTVLDNNDGTYTPDNPLSARWPNLVEGKRMRVKVTKGSTSTRFLGRIVHIEPAFPSSLTEARTTLTALDALADVQQMKLRAAYENVVRGETGLVEFYPLTEASGAVHAESAANASKLGALASVGAVAFGTGFAPVTSSAGPVFPSSSYLVSSGNISTTADTVEFWFETTDANVSLATFGSSKAGGPDSIRVAVVGGNLHVYRTVAGVEIYDAIAGAVFSGVNDGQPHHFVYSEYSSGGQSRMQVYLDTTAATLVSSGGPVYPAASGSRLTVAGATSTTTAVSNVALYNRTGTIVAPWVAAHAAWTPGQTVGGVVTPAFSAICTATAMATYLSTWLGVTVSLTSASTKELTLEGLDGLTGFDAIVRLARSEGGAAWCDYSTGGIVVLSDADSAPRAVTLTVDAAADGIGGPVMSRTTDNRVAVAIGKSPANTVTVTDATLLAQIGAAEGNVESMLSDPVDLHATASALIARGRDQKLRLRSLTYDCVTATNDLYSSTFALAPFKRVRYSGLSSSSFGVTYIDGYAQGWTERIGYELYEVVLDLSPDYGYGIWDTSRWAWGDGVCTCSALTSSGTSVTLTWSGSVLLSTVAGDYPLDLNINGERVTIASAPGSGASPCTVTITRGVAPTVARAHSAGEAVEVWDPLIWS